MDNKNFGLAAIFIVAASIFRLLPHPPNATPVAAMALVGGIYISRKYLAILLPILALFIGDLILNNTINRPFFEGTGFIVFDEYMITNYLAFIVTVGIGFLLVQKTSFQKILFGTLFSSIGFFVITNLGTWMTSVIYPKNFVGLSACFTAAIPFFRNTLLSNAIFISLFVLAIDGIRQLKFKSQLS